AVWMRRVAADRMLDRLVEDGTADAGVLGRVAHLVADFHARASAGPSVAVYASREALHRQWTDVLALAEPLVGGPLPRASHAILAEFGPDFLARQSTLLATRQATARIRDGHGDLRTEHVCLIDAPVPAMPPLGPMPPGIYVI